MIGAVEHAQTTHRALTLVLNTGPAAPDYMSRSHLGTKGIRMQHPSTAIAPVESCPASNAYTDQRPGSAAADLSFSRVLPSGRRLTSSSAIDTLSPSPEAFRYASLAVQH